MSGGSAVGPLHVDHDGTSWVFEPSRPVEVGRHLGCDITLDDERVSRAHLALRPGAEDWVLADLGSRNGTWVDGAARRAAVLPPGSTAVVRVGDADGPALVLRHGAATGDDLAAVPRSGPLVVGRDPSCDVVVDDPLVSRRHAVVERGERAVLTDLSSFNGTYHDGRAVTGPVVLAVGDAVGVGNAVLVWTGSALVEAPPVRPSLEARHLGVTTTSGSVLLDDVSVALPAGSLTALIGPSGAGKSTLLGALTGLRPAGRGSVTWAGRDLYGEYDQLRFLVGLVPQEDIVHRQLTVARALRFAAQLRLPPDVEHEPRIDAVLAEVGLLAQKHQRIDTLSGGQLKRTSIALELLTAPRLLFLDEPTSGLDPGLDRQIMLQLRALADGGRVVVVVTHSVLALDVCDRVLLMAPGGRVAFSGPPEQLLPAFGVGDHPAVFAALQDPDRAAAPTDPTGPAAPSATAARPPEEVATPPRPAPVRQCWTLARRNLAVAMADRMFLVLLLTMPVLLAAMSHAFPGEAGLSARAASGVPAEAQQRLLVLVIGAALMGTTLSVRDLVTERPIYRREHAVGLHPAAYLASKVFVLGGLVAIQSVVFTVLALTGVRPPDDALVLSSARLEIAVAVAAVGVAMTVAALAVSAAARSADQTMPALVGLVMAQLVFCGGLFGVVGRPGLEQLAWLLPARFGYAAAAATSGVQPLGTPDPLFESTAEQWLLDLGGLGLQTAAFTALAAVFLGRSVLRGRR